jgi:hypothetical protein
VFLSWRRKPQSWCQKQIARRCHLGFNKGGDLVDTKRIGIQAEKEEEKKKIFFFCSYFSAWIPIRFVSTKSPPFFYTI